MPLATAARFVDAGHTQVAVTIGATEWHGIAWGVDAAIRLPGDAPPVPGPIGAGPHHDALRAWLGAGHMPTVHAAPATDLAAYAAERRWRAEVGGCLDPEGRAIATDRDSQAKLLAEMVAIGAGLRSDPSPWKCADGAFASLTNAQMVATIATARAHVAAAFAVERDVVAAIAAGTITTKEQIDAAAWPAT